ncbi:MAG: hypothetical protein JJV98_11210 [Desulfosarcina sp.]|nr:hypothetical protein [Desulfobacterales bacterium]
MTADRRIRLPIREDRNRYVGDLQLTPRPAVSSLGRAKQQQPKKEEDVEFDRGIHHRRKQRRIRAVVKINGPVSLSFDPAKALRQWPLQSAPATFTSMKKKNKHGFRIP